MESRKSLSHNLASHYDGRSRPETARDPADGGPPVVGLGWDGEPLDDDARDQLVREARSLARRLETERKRSGRRGRKPAVIRDFLFAGFNGDREQTMAWGGECIRWLKGVLPGDARLAVASLHMDEAAGHLHVVTVIPGGWTAVERGSRVGAGKLQGRTFLHEVQNDLHRSVSAAHGLGRGEIGSQRKHVEVDRSRSLQSRVDQLEAHLRVRRDNYRKLGRAFVMCVPDRDKAVGALEAAGHQSGEAVKIDGLLRTLRPEVPEPRPEKRRRTPEPAQAAPRGR